MEKDYESLLKHISHNIKKHRKKLNLTQEGMTNHGFNYKYYQKLESGSYSMNLYTLYRLAKVFNVKVKQLLP